MTYSTIHSTIRLELQSRDSVRPSAPLARPKRNLQHVQKAVLLLSCFRSCRGTWVGSRNLRRCCNGGVVSAGDRDVTVFGRVEGSRRRDEPHTGSSKIIARHGAAARAALGPPHMSTLPEGRASATRPQLAPCDSRKRAMADSQALTRTSRPGPAWQSPWPWPASALRTSAKIALCPALLRPQGINQPVKASTTPATHRHARPCTTGGPTSRRLSRTLSEQQRAATAAASSSNSSEQQQQQRTTAASSRSEQQQRAAAASSNSEQQQQ